MLTAAHPDHADLVRARVAPKGSGGYFCPDCQRKVILKKGRVRVHHFAHKPPVTCFRGKGESPQHRKCKEAIWLALSQVPDIHHLGLERQLGSIRPDVSFAVGQQWVGIEIQRSPMTRETVMERMKQYIEHGIAVLWVKPELAPADGDRCRPRDWLTWLHGLYYGRVYYWSGEAALVQAVHFEAWETYVKQTSYYDQYGEENVHGGYWKTLKRTKKAVWGPRVDIATNFGIERRKAYRNKTVDLPAATIVKDHTPNWWKSTKKPRRT